MNENFFLSYSHTLILCNPQSIASLGSKEQDFSFPKAQSLNIRNSTIRLTSAFFPHSTMKSPIKILNEKFYSYSQLDQEVEESGEHSPPQTTTSHEAGSLRKLYLTLACLILVTIPAMVLLSLVSRSTSEVTPGYQDVLFEPRVFHRTSFEESNKAWKCLPNGNGLVHLDSAAGRSLSPGLPSDDGGRNLYGISWTHQLYCLGIIRDEFYSLVENRSERILDRDALGKDSTYRLHVVEECYDYLRQKIFCTADMTIEGAASGPDGFGNQYHIDGFGIEHQCRVKVCIVKVNTHELC